MLRKITIDDLRVGMYVEKVDRGWLEVPFFRKQITSRDQIEKLRKYFVRELHIDTARGADVDSRVAVAVATPEPGSPPALEPPKPKMRSAYNAEFREELPAAKQAYKVAVTAMHDIFADVRAGRQLHEEQTREVVEDLVDSCMRNDDALASLTKLMNFDEYTFSHSVNVTVFALTLGKALGLDRDELQRFGESVLLHDVGKMLVPPEILNKPGKLTASEFEIMKTHTTRGVEFLQESFPHRSDIPIVAHEHHERCNGSGYPRGLRGEEITQWGRITAVADVYDALTSKRCYKEEQLPYKAMALIYSLRGKDFEPLFVDRFIECVGVYPMGSLVRLTTGEVGLVVSIRHDDLIHPHVLALYRHGVRMKAPKLMDLAQRDESGKFLREVDEVLSPDAFGVNPAAHILEV